MSTSNTFASTGIFDELRQGLNTFIDRMEGEQSKINKAFFEALSMDQRAVFLKNLEEKGISRERMEKITGKEQSTISRTINRK